MNISPILNNLNTNSKGKNKVNFTSVIPVEVYSRLPHSPNKFTQPHLPESVSDAICALTRILENRPLAKEHVSFDIAEIFARVKDYKFPKERVETNSLVRNNVDVQKDGRITAYIFTGREAKTLDLLGHAIGKVTEEANALSEVQQTTGKEQAEAIAKLKAIQKEKAEAIAEAKLITKKLTISGTDELISLKKAYGDALSIFLDENKDYWLHKLKLQFKRKYVQPAKLIIYTTSKVRKNAQGERVYEQVIDDIAFRIINDDRVPEPVQEVQKRASKRKGFQFGLNFEVTA